MTTQQEVKADAEESEGDELRKARANAKRRALIDNEIEGEIAQAIRRQYPSLSDQAEDIASKAIIWAEQYQPGCIIIHKDIPKKITDMNDLNSRFAQLEAQGNSCVTINRRDVQPITLQDFQKRTSGEIVVVGVDTKGNPKCVPAGKYWTENFYKKIYREIKFTNHDVNGDTYNLFTGFGVVPEQGECRKIKTHIFEVICACDEKSYNGFLDLLAWQVQNIGNPSRVVVVFKSKEQQSGKGTILELILKIYGGAGFMASDLGQITGRFNDALRGKSYIFLDEALFSGDYRSADRIKSLSTTTRLGIETKGLPIVQVPAALNFFMATNHENAAHIEEFDERYWVLEVSPHRVKDVDYFADLYHEINNGGAEAFLYDLLNRDVSNFIPWRDIQKDNNFKDEMIKNSINPYDARKWLEDCVETEMIIGYKPKDLPPFDTWEPWEEGKEYINGMFFAAYTAWKATIRSPIGAKPTPANNFGELLNNVGFEQRTITGARLRKLPELTECRKKLEDLMKKSGKK